MYQTAPEIRISATDHQRLMGLISRLPERRLADVSRLEEELHRAEIVPDGTVPHDVIAMDSVVVYEDLDTGKVMMVQLTYPDEADVSKGRISVLAPIGAALLGLKTGQTIDWPLPDGRMGRLRVRQLIQPADAAGRRQVSGS